MYKRMELNIANFTEKGNRLKWKTAFDNFQKEDCFSKSKYVAANKNYYSRMLHSLTNNRSVDVLVPESIANLRKSSPDDIVKSVIKIGVYEPQKVAQNVSVIADMSVSEAVFLVDKIKNTVQQNETVIAINQQPVKITANESGVTANLQTYRPDRPQILNRVKKVFQEYLKKSRPSEIGENYVPNYLKEISGEILSGSKMLTPEQKRVKDAFKEYLKKIKDKKDKAFPDIDEIIKFTSLDLPTMTQTNLETDLVIPQIYRPDSQAPIQSTGLSSQDLMRLRAVFGDSGDIITSTPKQFSAPSDVPPPIPVTTFKQGVPSTNELISTKSFSGTQKRIKGAFQEYMDDIRGEPASVNDYATKRVQMSQMETPSATESRPLFLGMEQFGTTSSQFVRQGTVTSTSAQEKTPSGATIIRPKLEPENM